jgi:hypothetical protein
MIGNRRSRSKQRLLEHKRNARRRASKRFPRVQPESWTPPPHDEYDGYDTEEENDERTR